MFSLRVLSRPSHELLLLLLCPKDPPQKKKTADLSPFTPPPHMSDPDDTSSSSFSSHEEDFPPAAASAGRNLRPANTTTTGEQQQFLKAVIVKQQDATKTCRLLALEVGSLKAELTREQKKRAQAIQRATQAETALQHAEAHVHELQYTSGRLQTELADARAAAESSGKRVHALRQGLADAQAEARDMAVCSQHQVSSGVDCTASLLQTHTHTNSWVWTPHLPHATIGLALLHLSHKDLDPANLSPTPLTTMYNFGAVSQSFGCGRHCCLCLNVSLCPALALSMCIVPCSSRQSPPCSAPCRHW